MNENTKPKQQTKPSSGKKPNENGVIKVEGHIRIFDPTTKQIFVEKRA
jgi:hypothetical protein